MYDIFICAGQSNMSGHGYGDTKRPYAPDERVLMMTTLGHIVLTADEQAEPLTGLWRLWYLQSAVPRGFLGLSFAREYIEQGGLAPDRRVLLLKAAVGGTGFGDHRWGLWDDLYLNMLAMIRKGLALHPEARVAALLWHQGETDVMLQTPREQYEEHLARLVTGVRNACGNPELPFLAGGFVPQWRQLNRQTCTPILSATRKVVAELGHAAFVESDGLSSNQQKLHIRDNIHFSRSALYQFGQRYFEAWQGIVKDQ